MWIIVLCSVTAVGIFLERLFALHRASVPVGDLLRGLANILRRENYAEALQECATTPGPVARVAHAVILRHNAPRSDLREIAQEAGQLPTSQRLGLAGRFRVGGETHDPTLLKNCDKLRAANPGVPFFLFVDSLQCMDDGHYPDGSINSKSAERSLALMTDWAKAKANFTNPVVIGQVTKGGQFQGSNTLKHMVDTMIHLSIERKDEDFAGCRILETVKNRFGSSGSKAYLGLTEGGFKMVGLVG